MTEIRSVRSYDELAVFCEIAQDVEASRRSFDNAKNSLGLGRTNLDNYIIEVNGEGEILAAVLIAHSPAPAIPRFSKSISQDEISCFEDYLYHVSLETGRCILLRSDFSPSLDSYCKENWLVTSHEMTFETDLSVFLGETNSKHITVYSTGDNVPEKTFADVKQLGDDDLSDCINDSSEVLEGAEILIYSEDGEGLGCAVVYLDRPHFSSIRLLGVKDSARGRGVGTHLHRAALIRSSLFHKKHLGSTSVDNLPMIKIFKKNGSVLKHEELYLTPVRR